MFWKNPAYILAAALWCLGICCAPTIAGEIPVPEYYLGHSYHPCFLKIDVAYRTPNAASTMFRFLGAFYNSDSLHNAALIVGVDYVALSNFYWVTKSTCPPIANVHAKLSKYFPEAELKIQKAAGTPDTGPVSDLTSYPGGIGRFIHYRGRSEIGNCLIKLTAIDADRGYDTFRSLLLVGRKYHPPFADVLVRYQDVFILLSRQCAEKQAVYRNVVHAVELEFPSSGLKGNTVDFSPNPQDLLRTWSPSK